MLPSHCVCETKGAQIFAGLITEPTDFVIRTGENKQVPSRSGFQDQDGSATLLARLLRSEDITDVYVVGNIAWNNVEATIYYM